MTTSGLDRVLMEFEDISQNHVAFEAAHGEYAAAFLTHLPWLFRLFRRVPFDESLPLRARHAGAVVAFYLAENQDFMGPSALTGKDPAVGLIDDVFAAYFGLKALVDMVGDEEKLAPHWRSSATDFEQVVGLCQNLEPLREKVPPKVLERVEALLRMPR